MSSSTTTTQTARATSLALASVTQITPLRLSGHDAARYLGLAPQTLANWRSLGKGPRFMRDGRVHSRIFYLVEDLEHWVREQSVEE